MDKVEGRKCAILRTLRQPDDEAVVITNPFVGASLITCSGGRIYYSSNMNPYIELHEKRVDSLKKLMEYEFERDFDNYEQLTKTLQIYFPQVHLLNFEQQDVLLQMMLRVGELKRFKPPRIEADLFVCSSFSWPIKFIKESGFEYWWKHAVETMYPDAELNKTQIHSLIMA